MIYIRKSATIFILSLLVIEVLLRVVDPIGVMAYARNVHWSWITRKASPSGYIHTPGVYRVSGVPVSIGRDGLRITPPSTAACTVVVLGDSVAFGLGVGDTDTFVWHLAERFPKARWINAARTGYNADNLSRAIHEHPADGYLYYAVSNDTAAPTNAATVGRLPLAVILHYRLVRLVQANTSAPEPPDYTALDALGRQLYQRGALIAGADTHAVTAYLVARGWGAGIAPHGHPISPVDPHPTADGHRHIAGELIPLVADWLPGVCSS